MELGGLAMRGLMGGDLVGRCLVPVCCFCMVAVEISEDVDVGNWRTLRPGKINKNLSSVVCT